MMLRTFIILMLLVLFRPAVKAQDFQPPDISPMDMAYFPDNFPHSRKGNEEALIRVIYSRPKMSGRDIFGALLHYGELWRTGANESTEIKFYKAVSVKGHRLGSGTYSLFTIPGEKEWVIIFNRDVDHWGAYQYNPDHDALRISVPALMMDKSVEHFSIQFKPDGARGAIMQMGWAKTLVEVPFEF